MADERVEYLIQISKQGDGAKQAKKDLDELKTSSSAASVGLQAVGKSFLAAAAAYATTGFVRSAIREFAEAEKAVAKLNSTLRATQQLNAGVSDRLQGVAKNIAGNSPFSQTELLNSASRLLTAGASPGDIERLTRAIADVSTLMDRDLGRASQAMVNALRGDTDAFRALGIEVESTGNATEDFNKLLEKLEKLTGGQAAASMDTLTGKLEKQKKQWDELKEKAGGYFSALLGGLVNAAQWVGQGIGGAINMPSGMGGVQNPIAAGILQQIEDKNRGQGILSPESWAALMKSQGGAGAGPAKVTTSALAAEDLRRFDQMIDEEVQIWIEGELKKREEAQKTAETVLSLQQDIRLASATGYDRELVQITVNHERRVAALREQNVANAETLALEEKLFAIEKERAEFAISYLGRLTTDLKAVGELAQTTFASGLSDAIVEGFRTGRFEMKKFFSDFFALISKAILQTIILNLVRSGVNAIGGIAGGGFSGGGAGGLGEVVTPGSAFSEVNSINIPRLSTGTLAGKAGGNITIRLEMSPEVEARVQRNSIQGARIEVARDMRQDSALSRNTRRLTSGM